MSPNQHAEALDHLVNQGPYDWHYAGRVMRRAAEEIRRLQAANHDNMAWYEAAKHERDELLDALQKIAAYPSSRASELSSTSARMIAREAIEKVGGKK